MGASCDVHYGQLVSCGNFFFLDQIQEADEIWASAIKEEISFSKIYMLQHAKD